MSAGNALGHYITSEAFFTRARKVVEETVSDLEARGFTPVYDLPKRTGSMSSGMVVKISVEKARMARNTFKAA